MNLRGSLASVIKVKNRTWKCHKIQIYKKVFIIKFSFSEIRSYFFMHLQTISAPSSSTLHNTTLNKRSIWLLGDDQKLWPKHRLRKWHSQTQNYLCNFKKKQSSLWSLGREVTTKMIITPYPCKTCEKKLHEGRKCHCVTNHSGD